MTELGVYQAIVRDEGRLVGITEVRVAHTSLRVSDGVVVLGVADPPDVRYVVEVRDLVHARGEEHEMLLESVDSDRRGRFVHLDSAYRS